MTGFGSAEGIAAGGKLRIEIKSVNHRFFNLSFKAPSEFLPFELELRERLRRDFDRGHLSVSVRWIETPESRLGVVRLNVARAEEAMARLRELQTAVGIQGEITLDLIARQPEVFAIGEEDGPQVEWLMLEPIVIEASAHCRAMRQREGIELVRELVNRLGAIRSRARSIASRAPERLIRERDRLRGSVALLLDGRPLDRDRLEQELALLADKLDITEELVRFQAHLDACRAALGNSAPAGKQLGFLAQELGREINTIGSKANDAAITQQVILMKGELEKFREQLENLE